MLISIPMITIAPSTPPMIMLCGGELSTTMGMGCVELSVENMTSSVFSFSVIGLFSTMDVVVIKIVECGSFMEVVVVPPSVGDLSKGRLGVISDLGSHCGTVKLVKK